MFCCCNGSGNTATGGEVDLKTVPLAAATAEPPEEGAEEGAPKEGAEEAVPLAATDGESPKEDAQQPLPGKDEGAPEPAEDAAPVQVTDASPSDKAAPEPVKEAKEDAVSDAKNVGESSFAIEFDCEGETKTIVFTKAPFGITFPSEMPLKVEKAVPDSEAAKLGVEKGWVLKTLGGQPTEGLEFSAAMDIIKKAAKTLPQA